MNRNVILIIALAAAAVACTQAPARARHTVEEYLADDGLRQKEVARCANDPGSIGQTPDCINAAQAENRAGQGSFAKRFRPTP
jgi:hypothetical protein